MTLGLAFYILLLIWFVFGVWGSWPGSPGVWGGNALQFLLFLLLGWHSFGAPIHG